MGCGITTNPPSLGRAGATTVVIVEIPGGAYEGFVAKLKDKGTFVLSADAPARRARIRIEVERR